MESVPQARRREGPPSGMDTDPRRSGTRVASRQTLLLPISCLGLEREREHGKEGGGRSWPSPRSPSTPLLQIELLDRPTGDRRASPSALPASHTLVGLVGLSKQRDSAICSRGRGEGEGGGVKGCVEVHLAAAQARLAAPPGWTGVSLLLVRSCTHIFSRQKCIATLHIQ
jgi:hypothetical protein